MIMCVHGYPPPNTYTQPLRLSYWKMIEFTSINNFHPVYVALIAEKLINSLVKTESENLSCVSVTLLAISLAIGSIGDSVIL